MECSLWSRYSLWCFIANSFNTHTVRKLESLFLYIYIYLSCLVRSNSLQSHGPYSPQTSPGQNTGVGSLSLLQVIFPTQGQNPGLPHCQWILYQLSTKGSPHYSYFMLTRMVPKMTMSRQLVGKEDGMKPRRLVSSACTLNWFISKAHMFVTANTAYQLRKYAWILN